MKKRIAVCKNSLSEFGNYIQSCLEHPTITDSKTFTDLLFWHLKQIQHKIVKKLIEIEFKHTKNPTLVLDYPEIKTLSYLFNHIQTGSFLKLIEFEILQGL